MSDDTQSETHSDEHNDQKNQKNEKIKQLRDILGPKDACGSSMGLAYDLQSERTRLKKKESFQKDRPPEFTELEWKALSRTTRFPDNSTLGGSRICKAYYEHYRTSKILCGLLKEEVGKSDIVKVHLQTIKVELYECDVNHPDHFIISRLLFNKDGEYNSSKNDIQEMQRIKENGILWAYNTFVNVHCVQNTLDDKFVKEYLQNPNKDNLMKIVKAAVVVHEQNERENDHFYEIDNFKRKYEDLTSESQEESEESEENSETKIKKPKRNDNEFLEHLRELNFMCPGVPGKACRLGREQLEKENFQYDHIWPWKFSKDDSKKNKRPLCMFCHYFKTNNIDKHLKDDYEAIQMLQNENMLPYRLMKLLGHVV